MTTIFLLLLALLWPDRAMAAIPQGDPARAQAVVVAGSGEVTAEALAIVERAVATELPTLRKVFGDRPKQRFFVFLHAARDGLPAELGRHLHADSPGFALLGQRQVHLVWGEMRRLGVSLRGVVVHELAHELLDQYAAPHGHHLPRWFHEGLAQWLARDTYLGAREEDLVWRVGARRLPSFGELRERFPDDRDGLQSAYAQSYSYVTWLIRRFGLAEILAVAAAADERSSFERVLVGRTGRSTLELEDAWREHLLHGSGASWRAWLDQCFTLSLIGALPLLALALIRRLAAERRAAQRLAAAPPAGLPDAPQAGDDEPLPEAQEVPADDDEEAAGNDGRDRDDGDGHGGAPVADPIGPPPRP